MPNKKCCRGCDVCIGEAVTDEDFDLQAVAEGSDTDSENPFYEPLNPGTPNPLADCEPREGYPEGQCCQNIDQTIPLTRGGSVASSFFTTPTVVDPEADPLEYVYPGDYALIEAMATEGCGGTVDCDWSGFLSPDGGISAYWAVYFTFLKLYDTEDGPPKLGAGLLLQPQFFSSRYAYKIVELTEGPLKIDCSALSIEFSGMTKVGEPSFLDYCDVPTSITVERVA